VELRPRHGAYVRRRTAREGDEFFHVRRMLEIESARLAAARATPSTVAELRAVLPDGWEALDLGEGDRMLDASSRFHAAVVLLAGNGVLAETLALLDKRLRWHFKLVVVSRGPDSWQEHTSLVDAIAANDPEGGAEAMRLHTEGTRTAYLAQVDEAE
jgi:DNA-binding GntR family transcriptional regulator